MRAGSGPPGRARVIHHWADELLVKQDSVPDGEITLPVQERTQQAHPLNSSPADLIDVSIDLSGTGCCLYVNRGSESVRPGHQ